MQRLEELPNSSELNTRCTSRAPAGDVLMRLTFGVMERNEMKEVSSEPRYTHVYMLFANNYATVPTAVRMSAYINRWIGTSARHMTLNFRVYINTIHRSVGRIGLCLYVKPSVDACIRCTRSRRTQPSCLHRVCGGAAQLQQQRRRRR
jgi:hypothetical protein